MAEGLLVQGLQVPENNRQKCYTLTVALKQYTVKSEPYLTIGLTLDIELHADY